MAADVAPRFGIPRLARVGALALSMLTAACSQAEIESRFVPSAELWERWTSHDPRAVTTVNHEAWSHLLGKYVTRDKEGLNRFAYRNVTAADRKLLAEQIAYLEGVPISRYNRKEQFAYWANLYNAVTVRTILDNYPVESIRDINDGFLSPGPWNRKLTTVEGVALSLNDIENRILRPIWRDPRVHYAVNCASVGCPNLRKTAFTASGLDRTLDSAARDYINSPRGVRIRADGTLVVSSIYIWFESDFGDSRGDVLSHLRRYAGPTLKPRLSAPSVLRRYDYDWALNEQR
jgi:hypothetical protein